MNITNPTNFGIPGLTLTTANAEGTGNAVRTGASILAFDATDPAAVAASAVVGSATVASRRDHVHSGVGGAGTVVDNAIARFNGTGGSSLQGYTSNSPTISDAGVITLASGQLVFPATQAASAGANDLDDYEEGTFTATIMDNSLDGGEASYNSQAGHYTKIGRQVMFALSLVVNSLGTLTGSETARIGGFPFTPKSGTGVNTGVSWGQGASLAIPAESTPGGFMVANEAYVTLLLWDATSGVTGMSCTEVSDGGNVDLAGTYVV